MTVRAGSRALTRLQRSCDGGNRGRGRVQRAAERAGCVCRAQGGDAAAADVMIPGDYTGSFWRFLRAVRGHCKGDIASMGAWAVHDDAWAGRGVPLRWRPGPSRSVLVAPVLMLDQW